MAIIASRSLTSTTVLLDKNLAVTENTDQIIGDDLCIIVNNFSVCPGI